MMQAQEAVIQNHNGATPQIAVEDTPVQAVATQPLAAKLQERREKLLQSLNSIKAECEATKERLGQLDTSLKRTEGAILILDQLMQEEK